VSNSDSLVIIGKLTQRKIHLTWLIWSFCPMYLQILYVFISTIKTEASINVNNSTLKKILPVEGFYCIIQK
jgi:hypothetical protein